MNSPGRAEGTVKLVPGDMSHLLGARPLEGLAALTLSDEAILVLAYWHYEASPGEGEPKSWEFQAEDLQLQLSIIQIGFQQVLPGNFEGL